MVNFSKLSAPENNYIETKPSKIPAKLHLPGIGIIDYRVEKEQTDGTWRQIEADDPNRMWHFARVTRTPAINPPSKAIYTPLQAALLGTCFAIMGAVVGVCAAFGVLPAAIVVGAMTVFMVAAVALSKPALTAAQKRDHEAAKLAQKVLIDFEAAQKGGATLEQHLHDIAAKATATASLP